MEKLKSEVVKGWTERGKYNSAGYTLLIRDSSRWRDEYFGSIKKLLLVIGGRVQKDCPWFSERGFEVWYRREDSYYWGRGREYWGVKAAP